MVRSIRYSSAFLAALLWLSPGDGHASKTAADIATFGNDAAVVLGSAAGICAVIPPLEPAAAVFGIHAGIWGLVGFFAGKYDQAVDKKTAGGQPGPANCGPFAPVPGTPGEITNAYLDGSNLLFSDILAINWLELAEVEANLEGITLSDSDRLLAQDAAQQMLDQSAEGLLVLDLLESVITADMLEALDAYLFGNEILELQFSAIAAVEDSDGNGIPDRIDAQVPEPTSLVLFASGIAILGWTARRHRRSGSAR